MTTRLGLTGALALLTLAAINHPAAAQRVTDTVVGSCVYARGASHCVRQYRYSDAGNSGITARKEPTEEELAEARDRDRQWVARCRPVLRQDAYGVGRYVYAARGCEYGRYQD